MSEANKPAKKRVPKVKPTVAPVGRPTKYDEKYCDEIITFFKREAVEERQVTTVGSSWEKTDIVREAVFFPTIQGFAAEIDVAESTIYLWAEEHPHFSEAITRAKAIQGAALLNHSMTNKYSGRMAMFFAINNMGMKNKTETDNRYPDGPPLVQIVDYKDAVPVKDEEPVNDPTDDNATS